MFFYVVCILSFPVRLANIYLCFCNLPIFVNCCCWKECCLPNSRLRLVMSICFAFLFCCLFVFFFSIFQHSVFYALFLFFSLSFFLSVACSCSPWCHSLLVVNNDISVPSFPSKLFPLFSPSPSPSHHHPSSLFSPSPPELYPTARSCRQEPFKNLT